MDKLFHPVNLLEKDAYYDLWDATPLRSLDYTLANLWGWQEYYGLEWRFDGNLCWIKQTRPELAYWAPIGAWHDVDWPSALADAFPEEQKTFNRVPLELAHTWLAAMPGMACEEEERGQWEYLYRQDELANLPGNRFHKKRNHLNSYVKTYGEPDYQGITSRMVEDVLAVQDTWCQWHECDDSPSLMAENEAINRVLSHWNHFRGMSGGSLYVDGVMVAFAVGEKLDDKSLGVHFEKGLNGYKGVYQTINCEFAKHAGQGFTWINRAQDLDEEGLRQAKMTYQPADFLKKSKVKIKK